MSKEEAEAAYQLISKTWIAEYIDMEVKPLLLHGQWSVEIRARADAPEEIHDFIRNAAKIIPSMAENEKARYN